jgi:hypothetical protein
MGLLFFWSKKLRELFFRRPDFNKFFNDYVNKRYESVIIRYNARSNGYENITKVFNYKNDGTKISVSEHNEMKDYFLKILRQLNLHDKEIDDKVIGMSNWLNKKFSYVTDASNYGRNEYWSSPYDMFLQLKNDGIIEDDCDGYAILMVYMWGCLGVPSGRRFVRAGDVYDNKGNFAGGHATACYWNERYNEVFPIEGSFYALETNNNYEKIPLRENKLYGKVWFYTNESDSFKGNKFFGGL